MDDIEFPDPNPEIENTNEVSESKKEIPIIKDKVLGDCSYMVDSVISKEYSFF
jgi:hypothetical protein